ncbi:MAG: response regulator [Myxococcota bacterium]
MNDPAPPKTLVLVEDEPRTRERLAAVVAARPELDLVASAATFAEGRAALDERRPDVLITDLGLPDGDGTDLIRRALEARPDTLCMVVTVFGDEQHVLSAIEAGALGYLLKDRPADQLGAAILEMLAGGSPISASIARHLLRRLKPGEAAAPARPQEDDVPPLSPREHEVLRCVVKGFTVPEIARLLGVSGHTVTTHVRGIYRKLSVHSRGEAIYEALQLGLVQIDE